LISLSKRTFCLEARKPSFSGFFIQGAGRSVPESRILLKILDILGWISYIYGYSTSVGVRKKSMKSILIASAEPSAVKALRDFFEPDYQVDTASSREECIRAFAGKSHEFLFIDIGFIRPEKEDNNYKIQLQPFWRADSDTEIVILTDAGMIREAVKAVKAGGSNYLTFPVDPDELKFLVEDIRRDIRFFAELKYLRGQFWRRESHALLQTGSSKMVSVLEKIRAVAPTDTTVLLTGETGTGKGVFANLIHRHSQRIEKQFISVHCGAIPDTLLESELFGHEKGAFTGAERRKMGKFEIAHGGTIFLDEIGTITPSMQIKLLQILQDKTFQRVGGETTMSVNVRVIVATNADLKKMCDEGSFRNDLYYRLNVFPVEIPPLRERSEDIPLLVGMFLKRLNRFSLKQIVDIDPDVLKAFGRYEWPGNIRELENLIERAYVIEESPVLTRYSFPEELFEESALQEPFHVDTSMSLNEVRRQAMEKVERQYLMDVLAQNRGRIHQSAGQAGIGDRQLHKLMAKYGIKKEDFKGKKS